MHSRFAFGMWLGGEFGGDVFAGGKAAEPARRNMPLMVYFFGSALR